MIEFKARFGGSSREIVVPIDHVIAIYARENGQGMAFPMPTERAGRRRRPRPSRRAAGRGRRAARGGPRLAPQPRAARRSRRAPATPPTQPTPPPPEPPPRKRPSLSASSSARGAAPILPPHSLQRVADAPA